MSIQYTNNAILSYSPSSPHTAPSPHLTSTVIIPVWFPEVGAKNRWFTNTVALLAASQWGGGGGGRGGLSQAFIVFWKLYVLKIAIVNVYA